MRLLYCFLLLFLWNGSILFAQNLNGFKGKVLSNQQPVRNAKINLLNTPNSAVSNQVGEFSLRNLKPGTYQIQIIAEGYATYIASLSVTANQQYKQFEITKLGQQLSEVVVTAQKLETDLQQTPISISGISAQEIKNSRIWNTENLSGIVPNLYAGHPGDYRNVTSIRGVVTTSYNPAVATYIDGVNQFGLDTYISQLNDVEKIEVLRGPQGTLFGRNATGGVINIVTKQPDNNFAGFIDLSYGNFNAQRYTGGVKGALVKDKLFFGMAGMFTKQDGFYHNEFTNTAYDNQKGGQGNYYLKYQANPRLSFLVNVKHQLQLNNGAFPLAGSPQDALEKPFVLDQNNITQMRDRTFNGSLSAKYYHPNWMFTSQTAYQENYRYYVDPIDGDFSSFDIISVINNYGSRFNNVKVLTQEFRLASATSLVTPLKWQIGAYSFLQDNPVKQGTYFGDDAGMYGSPMTNFTSINTNLGKGFGFALFGQATYTLNPQLELVAGLRYDYERQKQKIKGEFLPDGGTIMVTQPDTSSSASFKAFSPKLALNFKVTSASYLYASYSRGFRAGGISQLAVEPDREPPLVAYEPEYSNNFEIGSKNKFFDNRLKLNVALFYTHLNEVQVPTLVLPDAITVVKNAGKLNSKGADVEISAILLKGLSIDYNFGLTDARYATLVLEDEDVNVSYKNNRQIFTPKTTSFLALQYGINLNQHDTRLTARAEWKNFGTQYFDLKNTISQNAYNVLNSRLSLQYKNIELALWAANLTDTQYISYAYNFGAAHLANPRTYGLTLISKF